MRNAASWSWAEGVRLSNHAGSAPRDASACSSENLPVAHPSPRDVGALRDDQVGGEEDVPRVGQRPCLGGEVLLEEPLAGDARIDDAVHRRSLSRRRSSVLSDNGAGVMARIRSDSAIQLTPVRRAPLG